MKNNYQRLFKGLQNLSPRSRLHEMILNRIESAQRRTAKIYLFFFSLIGVSAMAGLIPAFQYLATQFSQSSFANYFSLIFSDGGAILSYWKEFALSLAESLPVLGIAIFLATIFVLLWAIQIVARSLKNIFSLPHFIN